jgi:hypothetical protein
MPLVREMPEMRRNSPGEASLSGGDLPPLVGDQGGKADSPCVEPRPGRPVIEWSFYHQSLGPHLNANAVEVA